MSGVIWTGKIERVVGVSSRRWIPGDGEKPEKGGRNGYRRERRRELALPGVSDARRARSHPSSRLSESSRSPQIRFVTRSIWGQNDSNRGPRRNSNAKREGERGGGGSTEGRRENPPDKSVTQESVTNQRKGHSRASSILHGLPRRGLNCVRGIEEGRKDSAEGKYKQRCHQNSKPHLLLFGKELLSSVYTEEEEERGINVS